MFRGSYQRKLLTILQSGGSNPLEIWSIQVKNGWTRRLKDDDMGTIVFEIVGTNVATAFIVSPPDPKHGLGISLPFVTMIIKNLKRYFTFEIQILDDKQMRRRFRFSNYQSSTKIRPFACSIPLSLNPGWNQMQLNLANFTSRAYGTNYMETQRVQIHANCRIRRVFFSNRLYTEEELPRDYRTYLNVREANRMEQQQQQNLPSRQSQKLLATAPIIKADDPILSEPDKGPLPMDTKEDVIKKTSFKSIPSVDRTSVKSDSGKLHASTANVLSKTSVERTAEEKLDAVSKKSSALSTKSGETVKAVAFTIEDLKEESNLEDIQPGSENLPQLEAGTSNAEEIELMVAADTPRSDPTDSEYAESEAIFESDSENATETQPVPPMTESVSVPINQDTM